MMNEQNRRFDDVEGRLPDRFQTDLRGLFEPPGRVPPQIDKAILNQARRRLARHRQLIIRIRWAGGIAAAAAVVIVGVILYHGATSSNHPSSIIHHQSLAVSRDGVPNAKYRVGGPLDIDGNGRVDILDAFQLARHIEARGLDQTEWDLNGDGQVDRGDVDLVAFAAVRLASDSVGCVPRTSPKQERWCVVRTLPESRSSTRHGEGVPPLRVAGILPALRGRDTLDTKVQGQDALATSPFERPLDKGV